MKKISCICITYGRPLLLEEALKSFLIQDYENKELIILNDDNEIKYVFDHPQVKVVNMTERFSYIGEKRNYAISLGSGELIANWDDDDINLSHRLSYSEKQVNDFFKPEQAFVLNGNDPITVENSCFHAQSLFTRKLFYDVGGYNRAEDSGEDQSLENKIQKYLNRSLYTKTNLNELYYIYRWNHGYGHLSINESTKKHMKQDNNSGTYYLRPTWHKDYNKLVQQAINDPMIILSDKNLEQKK